MATSVMAAMRFRIGTPASGGTRLVTDRDRSESFWIYPALTPLQQMYGHEPHRWYFAPLGYGGNGPVSIPYPSPEAALRGLADTQSFKDSCS